MTNINIEPFLSIESIGVITVAMLICIYLSLRNIYKLLSPSSALLVIGLRILSALALIVLLLRPYSINQELDKNTLQMAVVADISGSMQTTLQANNKLRRIDISQAALNIERQDSWINKLRQQYPSSLYSLAEELNTLNSARWQDVFKSKNSALTDGLLTLLNNKQQDNQLLAGVVLLSDGINNIGTSWQETIHAYQEQGIPVSTIGIGDKISKPVLSLRFKKREQQALLDEDVHLKVQVHNAQNQAQNLKFSLWRESNNSHSPAQRMQTRTQNIAPNTKLELDFEVNTNEVGISVYTIKLEQSETNVNEKELSDKMLLTVNRPETLRILYLADSLQTHYRFIKHSLSNNNRYTLNSLIRISRDIRPDMKEKTNFYSQGVGLKPEYPQQAEFWRDFDLVILDSRSIASLNTSTLEGLKDFVSQQGGGLLVFGPLPDNIPLTLTTLLPVKMTQTTQLRSRRTLALQADRVFTDSDALQNFILSFAKDTLLHEPLDRKLSARTLIQSKAQQQAALLAQAYGAGKVAYWASESQWQWAMQSDQGKQAHFGFWQSLLNWLASNINERLQLPNSRTNFYAEQDIELAVNVLAADFSPAANAVVDAVLNLPDGSTKKLELFPQAQILGQYQTYFTPTQVGNYSISYQALLPNEEPLIKKSFFAVNYSLQENIDTSFQANALRKLSKLTGGRYYHYSELDKALNMPLRDNLPLISSKYFFFEQSWFLILILCLFGSEWILRRQRGLS